MASSQLPRRAFLRSVTAAGACLATPLLAQEPRDGLKEPVFRVARNTEGIKPAGDSHPLDPALDMAREALVHIQRDIHDYTCTIIKRERVKGVLGDYEYMAAKVRNRKVVDGRVVQPLSAYLRWLKPEACEGREVLWVEGKNNNKLRAKEGGTRGRFLPKVWLDPHGALAMQGNLYPITDIGIENLVTKLIERGTRDRKHADETLVDFIKNAKINGRVCTLLQVKHPIQRDYFDFHLAQIFVDDELNVPVRYAAYNWPAREGGQPQVIEEYTYVNMKLNVGLKDIDFDHTNPEYGL